MSMELRSPTAKILIVLACLVVVMAGIKAASTIMVPFFLSIFIAIACSPIIRWTSKFGVPKWLSITFVILLIVVFGFLLAGLVGQSMTEFRENLPEYRSKLDTEFAWVVSKLAEFNIHINRELIASHLDPATAMSVATNFISGMGGVLSNLFLILLTVIFMLWAVLAFMLNFIPNIGSIIAAVPAVLIAFVQLGPASAGFAALGFVLVNTIMGNMVEPRLMGKGMGLSTLVVFLSLIFWGWLLGTVGMLLSVPLTMVVKIALESREESKWLAVLLSSEGEKSAS